MRHYRTRPLGPREAWTALRVIEMQDDHASELSGYQPGASPPASQGRL